MWAVTKVATADLRGDPAKDQKSADRFPRCQPDHGAGTSMGSEVTSEAVAYGRRPVYGSAGDLLAQPLSGRLIGEGRTSEWRIDKETHLAVLDQPAAGGARMGGSAVLRRLHRSVGRGDGATGSLPGFLRHAGGCGPRVRGRDADDGGWVDPLRLVYSVPQRGGRDSTARIGGNRLEMLERGGILAAEGYGVLLYDERASGENEGEIRSYGCRRGGRGGRGGVPAGQGGGGRGPDRDSGVLPGGEIALRAAAATDCIRAVVAEAPGFATVDDWPPRTTLEQRWMAFNYRLSLKALEWVTGVSNPSGVVEGLPPDLPAGCVLHRYGASRGSRSLAGQPLLRESGRPQDLVARAGGRPW